MMLNRQNAIDAQRQRLSDLMDGEHEPDDLVQACQAWRSDSEVRSDWHTFHLIGDVMRSEDLAVSAGHDAAFLGALRARLAQEPVPLAPAPLPLMVSDLATADAAPAPVRAAGGLRRTQWLVAPAAVAAGFVAVAGVLVVLRGPERAVDSDAIQVSQAASGVVPVSATLLRDAGLERYLSAHRRVGNGVAMAVPGNGARNVDALVVVTDAK